MAKANTVESILFEIARTLDFERHDPTVASYKVGATAFLQAQREGRGFSPDIEWRGGKLTVRGGDWHGIPTHLLNLSKMLEQGGERVRSFAGQMNPEGVLTLQARNSSGRLLGDWTHAFSREAAALANRASPEMLAQADDTSGIPSDIVDSLLELNDFIRNRIHPLEPPGTVPVKFWNAPDHVVMCSALQYLPGRLLEAYDYDEAALATLPPGYRTAHTIFEMIEQIENEGLETAIENLGDAFRKLLLEELRRVGLPALAELFSEAWKFHPGSAKADAAKFEAVEIAINAMLDEDDATSDTICRYFSKRSDLFEQRSKA